MCGRCRQVFNAFQSLSRVEDNSEAHARTPRETAVDRTVGDEIPTPFSAADSTAEPVADRLFLREEPSPLPAAFSASEPLPELAGRGTTLPGLLAGSSAIYGRRDEDAAGRVPTLQVDARESAQAEPGINLSGEQNSLLVEVPKSRVAPEVAATGVWRLGVFVLFIGLLAQAAYAFRTTLVSNYPQLRPVASEVCEFAGCSLSWGRDEAVLKIEASELIESPGKPGRILLTAILVNRGKTKQDLPSLELRLTDNANQVVVSRLLNPGDYLGRAITKDEGLVPNIELHVNVDLKLELSNRPPASGYGLVVFYP